MSILYFIIALGLLIFVHEFGHFLVAKRAGIKVEKFSLGFGPKILGGTWGETEYRISLLPLGGYVKLFGEEEGEAPSDDPRSFTTQPVRIRAAVVGAGPLMNLVLALMMMPIVFLIGKSEPYYLATPPVVEEVVPGSLAEQNDIRAGDRILSIGGRPVASWGEALNDLMLRPAASGFIGFEPLLFGGQEAIVGELRPGEPAEQAGLQNGDRIERIDRKPIADWGELSATIASSGGKPQVFQIDRDGVLLSFTLTPIWEPSIERFVIGIGRFERQRLVQYPFFAALQQGTVEAGKLLQLTCRFLGRLFHPLRRSDEVSLIVDRGGKEIPIVLTYESLPLYKSLGGPVRIARASSAAARHGIADFIYFLAFLSLQLALLNVLPIPVLDGGHLAFIGFEALSGRPLPDRARWMAMQIGFVFLVSLMILVTVGDIDALWGWRTLFDKVRQLF